MGHPVIVLEGPDGSGKTTLAGVICEQLGAKYIHATYRFKNQMHRYHWAVLEQALKAAATQPVVIDRWWPSEQVYAGAFRGGSPWPLMGRMLDRVALAHCFTYVLCYDYDRDRYLSNFESLKMNREEMYDSMEVVYDLYDAWYVAQLDRDDLLVWNYHDLDAKRAAQYVWEHAFDHKVGCANNTHERRWAGNPRAEVVLVGDRTNPKGRHSHWPFFEYGNSSLWITQALERLEVPEYDLCWVNIHNMAGEVQWSQPDTELFWGNNPDRKWVALGREAQAALDMLGYESKRVAHPSWSRRFNSKASVQELRNVLGLYGYPKGESYVKELHKLKLV